MDGAVVFRLDLLKYETPLWHEGQGGAVGDEGLEPPTSRM